MIDLATKKATIDLVTKKVLERLKASDIDINDIDFQAILDKKNMPIKKPKVNISVDTGAFKKITMRKYKAKIIISLILVVFNLRGEKQRKTSNYDLIDAIIDDLFLEKLGLDLQDPIAPVAFSNITDEDFDNAGYSLYQLDFTCSYNFFKTAVTGDKGELSSIVSRFFVDDTDESIETYILLNQIYGGDAWSDEFVEVISGGYAGTTDFIETITGGDAFSKHGVN